MNMKNDVCRAITFINFHIPLAFSKECEELHDQYLTVGFFDGMITERLITNYSVDGLKELWRYGLKRTAQSKGCYSYQNIFCFSNDEWNFCNDVTFWAKDTNRKYPLTFVVFLQLKEYATKKNAIGEQCKVFNAKLKKTLENGIAYIYGTIDKNDFVVCIKCRNYQMAVDAIKKLHETNVQIVYSYTVFSISNYVLEEISNGNYSYLYEEEIKSICLKGITNSFDSKQNITLDCKYYEFCTKLVEKLYDKPLTELHRDKDDFKIYDILGDDDFRLIARNLKLGNILQQFASGGMLCYREKNFQYYLFSSSLVLNTDTSSHEDIDNQYIEKTYIKMKQDFLSPKCDELEQQMEGILNVVSNYNFIGNDKMIMSCQAIWQLLQSLKALEIAPVKKYDFWSLYYPLSCLIRILESKISSDKSKDHEILNDRVLYEFIHKISMTFHGTLRTDIQFFQIRDFNVITHYAPAKLRAFYALWTLELSYYYNDFCDPDCRNQYSFIFSPGLFGFTSVKELIVHYEETERLLLITTPERDIYLPKWISIIIGHEVSHFVGYIIRNRKKRHEVWIQICARILELEMHYLYYYIFPEKYKKDVEERISQDAYLFESLENQLLEEEKIIRKKKNLSPHEFHSDNSFEIIKEAFRSIRWKYIDKFILDDCEKTKNYILNKEKIKDRTIIERNEYVNAIRKVTNNMYNQQLDLYSRFQQNVLYEILRIIKNITSESFADLMVILTLDLEPKDYIDSFIKSEMDLCNMTTEEIDTGLLLFVRLGVTIQTVCNVVKKNKNWFKNRNLKFYKSWKGDVLRTLPHKFPSRSIETNIAVKVYGYVTGIKKICEKISEYERLFKMESENFEDAKLDFFNDQYVFNYLCEYLEKCALTYLEKLRNCNKLQKQKSKLLSTYISLSEGTLTDMMQVIEDFLAAYEQREKDEIK